MSSQHSLSSNCESSEGGDASSCFDSNKALCVTETCGKPSAFAKTIPEVRRFGIVIINKCGDKVKATVILRHIWDLFENCEIADLKFSPGEPMVEFEGQMLVITGSEKTAQWLIEAAKTFTPPHEAVPFIKYFNLMRCIVTLPSITPNKFVCSLFEYFEKQNEGIRTDKWVPVGRRSKDPCTAADITNLQEMLGNDVLLLYIDAESRELIKKQCNKLKYIVWTVEFKFDDETIV